MVVMASGMVVGVVEEGVVIVFFYSYFIIILMNCLYYLNEIVKNIKVLMFDVF